MTSDSVDMLSGEHSDKVLTDSFRCQAPDVRENEGDQIRAMGDR
jgi:hypothetical protein